MKFPLSSIRSRAILLILLAIAPLLGLIISSYFDQCQRAIYELQRNELITAKNLATIQEIILQDSKKMLMTLAQLPESRRRDREACSIIIAGMLKETPYGMTIVAADAEGQMFASAPAYPAPVNYADRNWFKRARETKNLAIDSPVLGRISGKYGFSVAYPILNDEKQFMGTISSQFDLQWLGNFLIKNNFPPAAGMALIDSKRNILFRYPFPERYIGKIVPDFLVKAMTKSDDGVADGVGLYGDHRLFAFARLSPPWRDFRVIVGFPREWALGPANQTLVRNLFWLSLVAFFAVAAAWFGGDILIVQPIKRLRAVTERLKAGDLTVRSGSNYIKGELGRLSESFDQMAESLQGRTNDLQMANKRLKIEIEERQRSEAIVRLQRDLALTTSSTIRLHEALWIFLETGIHISGLDSGGIYLVDPVSGGLNLVCHQGLSDKFARLVSHYEAEDIHTRTIIGGVPLYAYWEDLPGLLQGECREEGLRSAAIIPITHQNRVIAAINIASHRYKEIPATAKVALQTLAAQMGSTIARIQAEEDLRESEERLRAVFEQAAVGVGLGDTDTAHFIKVNNKYCEIVGLTQEELLSTTFMAITHPDDLQADLDNVQKMRQGLIRHYSREKRYIRKDGSIVWVNVTASDIWKSYFYNKVYQLH